MTSASQVKDVGSYTGMPKGYTKDSDPGIKPNQGAMRNDMNVPNAQVFGRQEDNKSMSPKAKKGTGLL